MSSRQIDADKRSDHGLDTAIRVGPIGASQLNRFPEEGMAHAGPASGRRSGALPRGRHSDLTAVQSVCPRKVSALYVGT